MQDGPGGWVWREASYEIVYLCGRLIPVNSAGFLEDLGGRAQFGLGQGLLANLLYGAGYDVVESFDGEISS